MISNCNRQNMKDTEKLLEYLRGGSQGKLDLRWGIFCNISLREADLSGADLSDTNLSNSDLRGANLSNANLSKANLSKANLNGANLQYANLEGVDLSQSDLSYANLNNTNLCDANLSGAYVLHASFLDANRSGADFTDAYTRIKTYEDYEIEDRFNYGPYEGSWASDVEGLDDDFIRDVLGGEPDAYWSID